MTDTSTPILAEVVRLQAALIALNDVVIDLGKRAASLVEGGAPITCRFLESDSDVALPGGPYITKDMLATVHEGNAVVPTAWADLTSRSGKTPESSPGRTASGPGAA